MGNGAERSDNPVHSVDDYTYMPFYDLCRWLSDGNFAWVRGPGGTLEAVTAFRAGDREHIVSFSNSKWTVTFDTVTKNFAG